MSDKTPPSLDQLLKGVLDFTNTQKRVSEQIEILRKPMYIAKRQNITIPNPSEVLKSFQTTRELLKSADTLAQPYLDKGIIHHRKSYRLALEQMLNASAMAKINISFVTRLQFADSVITMQEGFKNIPNYGELLRRATSMPYASLYNNIFDEFNKDEFLKTFPADAPVDGDIQVLHKYKEIDEKDMKIVHPEYVEASEKLTKCIKTTNYYVTNNYYTTSSKEAETQTFWGKYGLPALVLLGQFIHQLGMSADPIADYGYVRAITKIIDTIQEHPVEQQNIEYELKEDNSELNKFDIIDSEKTSS